MNPESIKALVAFPWQIQLVIGSGFCAYRLAYYGIRQSHKSADEFFISIAFGLFTVSSLYFTGNWPPFPRGICAFFATIFFGCLWRFVGRNTLREALRILNYSWSDETESAWAKLGEEQHKPNQITVETVDGASLYCTSAAAVEKLPFGPYVLGTAGDVLMYVDKAQEAAEESPHEVPGMLDSEWGALITYLPKEQIKAVRIRFAPPTYPAEAAAGWMAKGLRKVAGKLRPPLRDPEQE